jgi:putative tryptophan/tyrosine transport system substrate-binding protein
MKTGNRESITAAPCRLGDGMKRRVVIAGLAALLAAPKRSSAQQAQAKVARVGWIWSGRSAGDPAEVAGFRQGLKELGYIEGQNTVVDYRFGEGRTDRLADFVAELVQLRPDVLVALGEFPIRAVMSVTTTIPVVSMTGDPVGAGYVANLARPGGNITGVSMMQGLEGLTGKRVELLKDALPAATRIGLMFNPDNPTVVGSLGQAEEVASRLGLVIRPFPVRRGDELEAVINSVAREGVDGVDIEPVLPFISYPRETGELLLKYRVPAVSELRRIAESGGLLSYGPNLFDAMRRLAYFVDRILKGAKPADLPVEQASRLELVVNMKTAQALGLTIPPSILSRADEVIE